MIQIYHELHVLTKSVQFKNLSIAANHVGLSQPQLSRIVSKLEAELGLILLDRSAKRKSGWTREALQLAETFRKHLQRLELDLGQMTLSMTPKLIRIGSLEGLLPISEAWAEALLFKFKVPLVQLDVFDYRELEQHFMSGDLDLIFTARSPSPQKFSKQMIVGYQKLQKIEHGTLQIFSDFEYADLSSSEKRLLTGPVLVSNSLNLRQRWLIERQGKGFLPVPSNSSPDSFPVLVIGSELLNPVFWNEISGLQTKSRL